jgi:hypothetical protein
VTWQSEQTGEPYEWLPPEARTSIRFEECARCYCVWDWEDDPECPCCGLVKEHVLSVGEMAVKST